jgi:asparaginyl-tRNA synthetase
MAKPFCWSPDLDGGIGVTGDTATITTVALVGQHQNQLVTLRGWLYNRRSSGKVMFLMLRDGTGVIQCVATRSSLGEELFRKLDSLNQESSLTVTGTVTKDGRAPGGYEIQVSSVNVVAEAYPDYPIALKEHGPDFLLDHRHLWIRTPTQRAILAIRAAIMRACREYLDGQGFLEVTAPIFTPSACEGTTTLVLYALLWRESLPESNRPIVQRSGHRCPR